MKKTAKGVSQTVKRELGFEEYKATVFDQSSITKEMYSIRSFKHELYTIATNKVALNAYCNKRYWHDDGVHAYAYGHKNIETLPSSCRTDQPLKRWVKKATRLASRTRNREQGGG